MEEQVHLDKAAVEGDVVRVRTIVEQQPVDLHDTLFREAVHVERVPIGRVVEAAPEVRREGDTMVLPVLEERLVVRKELVLVEEVRVRLARSSEPVEVVGSRRVMRAVVEREASSPSHPEGAHR